MSNRKVVLIHGLFMGAWVMKWLGRRLAQSGFEPYYFDYASRAANPRRHALDLQDFILKYDVSPCHVVAHSLGGLVFRHWADMNPEAALNRVVTIGSPHQGSAVARVVHRRMPALIGQSWYGGLDGQLPEWSRFDVAFGNIVGVSSCGLGRLICDLPLPHDGTVAQSETALSGSRVLQIRCGHTGLIFHSVVARQTAYFLQNGVFQAA